VEYRGSKDTIVISEEVNALHVLFTALFYINQRV
jgi:hypothetical protein